MYDYTHYGSTRPSVFVYQTLIVETQPAQTIAQYLNQFMDRIF